MFNIVNHPLDSLMINIRGTENVLESAHKYSKPVFVTSSSEVYGKNVSDSLKESDDRILGAPVTLRWSYSEAKAIDESIQKILLMQAHSFFLGGVPMLFYGDEVGYTNDYSYLQDEGKSYDNRWMHRPIIDWKKNQRKDKQGTVEQTIFTSIKQLLFIRKQLAVVADHSNLVWLTPHNVHVAGYLRQKDAQRLFCVFNFSNQTAFLTWYAFKEKGNPPVSLYDHWSETTFEVGADHEFFVLSPYGFALLEG